MQRVFILQHVHQLGCNTEDVKFIGVYTSRENADNAIERLVLQPGFRSTKSGFSIDEYEINVDHWKEGFTAIPSGKGIEET